MTDPALLGAIQLPDGTWVRGRGLRRGTPDGPRPDYGLYLGTSRLQAGHRDQLTWPHQWIDWPDFLLPRDFEEACAQIRTLHDRALAGQRVEVACGGGIGRTGTVIACLAVLADLLPAQAVTWTRAAYHHRAVETPWQRRWITRFATHRDA